MIKEKYYKIIVIARYANKLTKISTRQVEILGFLKKMIKF